MGKAGGPAVVVMEKMNRQQLNVLFSIFHIAKPRMVPLHQKISCIRLVVSSEDTPQLLLEFIETWLSR